MELGRRPTTTATVALILAGIALHAYEVVFLAEDGTTVSALGFLLWLVIPYAVVGVVLVTTRLALGALVAAAAVFVLDVAMHLSVFMFAEGSTAAVGLLAAPLWNTLLVVPFGVVVGWAVDKYTRRR